MAIRREYQLQIIWEYIPSPISIPSKTRKRLADLLGDLLSEYWEGRQAGDKKLPREDEHDEK